jgi:hypothetical protein
MSENDHSKGIADKDEIEAAVVQHAGDRVIIRRQARQPAGGGFRVAERLGRGFHEWRWL